MVDDSYLLDINRKELITSNNILSLYSEYIPEEDKDKIVIYQDEVDPLIALVRSFFKQHIEESSI